VRDVKSARAAGTRSGGTPKGQPQRQKRAARAAAPDAAPQAQRYSKTRRDHSVEVAEDYVELIAQLTREHGEARTVDVARRLGVSHVTATKTIARLQRAGLVRMEPYRSIFLTDAGRELASQSQARHELIVAFLRKLGVNAADAEIDAEGLEHHAGPATLEAIRRFVDGSG